MGVVVLGWLLGAGLALAAPLSVDGAGNVLGHGGEAVLADVLLPRPGTALLASGASLRERRGWDRWGRERLALVDASGADLAEMLVAAGTGVVDPDAGGDGLVRLLGLESEARAARRGLWGQGGLVVQPAEHVRGATGDLAHVEGRILEVGWAGDWLYLNFGSDRRKDFTVRALRGDVRTLGRSGVDLAALQGHAVRVRGWLIYSGGPMVEVTGPAQVEVLP